MPEVPDSTAVTRVLGQPRAGVSRHGFTGGNFYLLRMLNRWRDELGVEALPAELSAAVQRTESFLATASARLAVPRAHADGGRVTFDVDVSNLAGHKLPTAYPSRRAWLHVTVRDARGQVVFESGALDGARIAGNDNDEDAARFEPHHEVIARADQVQIYEAILRDARGGVTTGLLAAVGYHKDNRLLPRGFDKATAAADIAVTGEAARDEDFRDGGDRVRYDVAVGGAAGPYRVEVELRYQPIAFRWADNLRAYSSAETDRFVGYYEALATSSSALLARVELLVDAN
jgi:hypothetical protein